MRLMLTSSVSKDVTFSEDVFPMNDRLPKTLEPMPSLEQNHFKEGDIQVKLRSKRPRREPNLGESFIIFLVEEYPTTFEAAMSF